MRKLIYSMGVSLDGYIAGPDGDFAWSRPDEELHRFHNEQASRLGLELYGRRLYEVMAAWETIDTRSEPAVMADYAEIWRSAS